MIVPLRRFMALILKFCFGQGSSPFEFFKRSLLQVIKMDIGHSHCFLVPQLWWPGWSYKDHLRYFVFEGFAQNFWDHAKWGESIKTLVKQILLEDICWLAQWSGLHEKQVLIWWDNMETNRSISGVPLSWQILWNDWRASFHSEESELFLDSQSAVTFSFLGRYSAVRVIPYWRRWSHISFSHWTSFKFWIPPIFNWYVKATILPTWRWMALCFKVFENDCIASFMAKSSKTFMWFFIYWADNIPPVEILFHVAL